MISPLLANIYLHYVFDLWVEVWRRKVAKGDVIVVRYADDLVVGFESRVEAERFLRSSGTACEVRPGITSGEDATDRVRAVRRSEPEAAWRGKAGDLYLSGFHALLREATEGWSIYRMARNGEEADGGKATGN